MQYKSNKLSRCYFGSVFISAFMRVLCTCVHNAYFIFSNTKKKIFCVRSTELIGQQRNDNLKIKFLNEFWLRKKYAWYTVLIDRQKNGKLKIKFLNESYLEKNVSYLNYCIYSCIKRKCLKVKQQKQNANFSNAKVYTREAATSIFRCPP